MQDVPGAVEMIKDCFWGLSNIVLSDEQAQNFFFKEELLADIVFRFALGHPNQILRIEASHVIVNALSSCYLDTLLNIWVKNYNGRIVKFILTCSNYSMVQEERLHLGLLQCIDLFAQLENLKEEGKFVNFLQVFEENNGIHYLEQAQLKGSSKMYTSAMDILRNHFRNSKQFMELDDVSDDQNQSMAMFKI